jgi:PLP dependent protein
LSLLTKVFSLSRQPSINMTRRWRFNRATPCRTTLAFVAPLNACNDRVMSAGPAEQIRSNLERVHSQITIAARKAGRAVDDIELVAISKTHDAERVQAAYEAGQTLFGESRVQEARVKIPELPSSLRWHFVGHLQKNKIRQALPLFGFFHSVDSLALAQEMNRVAEEAGMHPRVLLEVNVSGEGSKFGFSPEKLRAEMESLLAFPRLAIEGLMAIPPFAPEAEASRRFFVELRELRDRLETEFAMKLPQLSMGMTNDFTVAVEEGATMVRVGTALFGERATLKKRRESEMGAD